MSWRFIVALIFAVIVSIFAIQNANVIDVDFLSFHLQISQALVILISAIIGAIVAMLLGIVGWLKQQSKIKAISKQVGKLSDENKKLQEQSSVQEENIKQLVAQLEEAKNATPQGIQPESI